MTSPALSCAAPDPPNLALSSSAAALAREGVQRAPAGQGKGLAAAPSSLSELLSEPAALPSLLSTPERGLCPPCTLLRSSVGRAPCHPPAMPAEPRAVPPTLWGLGMSSERQSSPQTAQQNSTFSSSQGACPARINHYPKSNNSMKPWMAAVPREGCPALFVSCPFYSLPKGSTGAVLAMLPALLCCCAGAGGGSAPREQPRVSLELVFGAGAPF